MTDFGYTLSSEEHGPRKVVEYARGGYDQDGFFRFWREELEPNL
jgi:hypothetical protein